MFFYSNNVHIPSLYREGQQSIYTCVAGNLKQLHWKLRGSVHVYRIWCPNRSVEFGTDFWHMHRSYAKLFINKVELSFLLHFHFLADFCHYTIFLPLCHGSGAASSGTFGAFTLWGEASRHSAPNEHQLLNNTPGAPAPDLQEEGQGDPKPSQDPRAGGGGAAEPGAKPRAHHLWTGT